MTQTQRIIAKFGGLAQLSRAIDPAMPLSVVQGWKDRGFVPARRQQDVLDAARRLGIDLTPNDFFAPTPPAEAADPARAA
jgi:hypothetical protein